MNPKIILLIKIIIAVLLLIFLINYVNAKDIYYTLIDIKFIYFMPALILVSTNIYLLYKKWLIISVRILGINDRRKVFDSVMHGFAAGIITPFRFGEYLARNIAYQADTLKVALATFFDKIFNLLIILFIGVASVIFLLIFTGRVEIAVLLSFLVLVIISLIVSAVKNSKIKKYILNLFPKQNYFKQLKIIIIDYGKYDIRFYANIIFLSMAHYFIVIIQYIFILKSFGAANNYIELSWYSSLVLFGKTIIPSVSFGEVGIREASSIFFAKYFELTNVMGFNTSILIFFINLLLPALLGTLFTFRNSK